MESISPSNSLKTLKIIHFVLMGGPLLFAVFVFYTITNSVNPQLIDFQNLLSFFPIGFAFIITPISFFMFKLTLKQNLEGKSKLTEKIAAYQTAHIIKTALLEGTALFTIVSSFVTNTYANLIAFAILFGLMLLSSPSAFKLTESLKLTPEENSLLYN